MFLNNFKGTQWQNDGGNPKVGPPESQFAFDLGKFGGWGKEDFLWKLLAGGFPGALNSSYFAGAWGQPASQQATLDQFNLATPEGARSRVSAFGRGQQEYANTQGRNLGNTFRSLGLGKGAQAGALIDAQNQARTNTADYSAQVSDPMTLARQRGDIANSAGQDPAMRNFLSLLGGSQQGQQKQEGGSFLDSVLGLLGAGTGLGINWGKVFHF